MSGTQRSWLLGYDITDPKRLQRIYRTLLRRATPIEYSIFLFMGTELALKHCIDEIVALIDESTDDFRCYPLPINQLQQRLGKATLPAGIYWGALPSTL